MFDHFVFTVSFLIGVQLPEFLQQYTQLITGKLAEANYHLQKFQSVADIHFNGEITTLITHYLNNIDPAIKHTGSIASDLFSRVEIYNNQILLLSNGTYLDKVYYFIKHIDIESTQLTLQNYQLAIPLTLEALSTGGICALLLLSLRMLLGIGLHTLVKRSRKPPRYI